MIDAHCHLDFEAFDADRDEVLDRAAAVGVRAIVIPGVSRVQWARAAALVRRGHPHVQLAMAVGLHPEHLTGSDLTSSDLTSSDLTSSDLTSSDATSDLTRELVVAAREHGAIAIGECGLDRRIEAQVPIERQRAVLDAHLGAARETGLPLVFHVVQRDGAMLDALRPHAPLRGMVHAFTGSPEVAREYTRLGLHLSFGGGLTRPRAGRARAALAATPADRVLLETDAPDQTPSGAPSPRNEPAFLRLVHDVVRTVRDDVDGEATARALFGL